MSLLNNCTFTKTQWKAPGTCCLRLDSVPAESSRVWSEQVGRTYSSASSQTVSSSTSNKLSCISGTSLSNKGKLFLFFSWHHMSEELISCRIWRRWLCHRKYCFSEQNGYLPFGKVPNWAMRDLDFCLGSPLPLVTLGT